MRDMIGEKIKRLRQEKGYSITELAKIADVSKSYLSQLERGVQTNPSLQFLIKIASPLGTTIQQLMGNAQEKEKAVIELDSEWMLLIQKAMENGLNKEDFKEYLNFLKFQDWIQSQNK
jgi:XRE family transcriptional regulator of biofilm formation